MKKRELLYIANRQDWRIWLENHHDKKKEIWLIYYKKHTGKPRIPYDDAVEEAICFGWIDTTVKRIDDEKFAQKFTPRQEKSQWSELNKKRARKMIKEGRMTKAGLAKIKELLKSDKKGLKPKPVKKKLPMPSDLKKALERNKKARANFQNFATSYQQLYIGWIISAKKEETRERRIKRAVKLAAENNKYPMM
jgi:uncharacterized protein YdeI (YjbR/CyaY-like superfamily)